MAGARKPLTQWRFTVWTGMAYGGMVAGLASMENGQSFLLWMLAAYLVLLVTGTAQLILANRSSTREPVAALLIGVTTVILGAGIAITAQPTSPVTVTLTVDTIDWTYSKGSGNHYELTATDGSSYELVPSDFSPPLPDGLDAPSLRGRQVMLTVDSGTSDVLAVTLGEQRYESVSLVHRIGRQGRGWIVGGLIAVVGAIALYVLARRFGWWPRLRSSSPTPY